MYFDTNYKISHLSKMIANTIQKCDYHSYKNLGLNFNYHQTILKAIVIN